MNYYDFNIIWVASITGVLGEGKRKNKGKRKRIESYTNTQDFLELSLIIHIRQHMSYVHFIDSRGDSKI